MSDVVVFAGTTEGYEICSFLETSNNRVANLGEYVRLGDRLINVVDPLANSCSKLEETSSRWSDDAKQSGNDTYSCANDLSRDREYREHSSECVSQLRDLLLGRPKLVGEVLKRISNCHQLLRLERLEHVTKRLRNRLKDLA